MIEFDEDLLEHALEICQDLLVPKADNPISTHRNQARTLLIRCYTGNLSVLRAIKFDHETLRPTAKIYDEFADWKLAAKLKSSKLTSADAVPEPLFGGSRISPEYARDLMDVLAVSGVGLSHGQPPPNLPLVRGEGLDLRAIVYH